MPIVRRLKKCTKSLQEPSKTAFRRAGERRTRKATMQLLEYALYLILAAGSAAAAYAMARDWRGRRREARWNRAMASAVWHSILTPNEARAIAAARQERLTLSSNTSK